MMAWAAPAPLAVAPAAVLAERRASCTLGCTSGRAASSSTVSGSACAFGGQRGTQPSLRRTLLSQPPAGQLAQRARRLQRGATAVEAGDAPGAVELSHLVNQELMYFIFQREFDIQLQRALNYNNFDAASEVRARRQKIDEGLRALLDSKGRGCGARGAAHTDEVDHATRGLRLRAELQSAVQEERYADAARLRDELAEVSAAAAQAAAAHATLHGGVERAFRLGQRLRHARLGYRAVVCGWDVACCESEAWQAERGVGQLARGAGQAWYHLLVDVRDMPASPEAPPIAYVAEELLEAVPADEVAEEGEEGFQHPYSYLLFLGTDCRGDLLPTRALRDKYAQARRDVEAAAQPPAEGGEEEGKKGGGGGGKGQSGRGTPGIRPLDEEDDGFGCSKPFN